MEITFTSHVQSTLGTFAPGDTADIHDGTARSLIDADMAVEGKLTKKKLKAELDRKEKRKAEQDASYAERMMAKAERLEEAGAPADEVDRVAEKAVKASKKKKE